MKVFNRHLLPPKVKETLQTWRGHTVFFFPFFLKLAKTVDKGIDLGQ